MYEHVLQTQWYNLLMFTLLYFLIPCFDITIGYNCKDGCTTQCKGCDRGGYDSKILFFQYEETIDKPHN